MTHDERDPGGWPEEDRPAEPAASDEPQPPADASEPSWERDDEPAPPASEIESWPSQQAEGGLTGSDEARPWPTEPPSAGSAAPETWPTRAPEQDEEPVDASVEAYPSAEAAPPAGPASGEEGAPSEVEAYPSGRAERDEPIDAAAPAQTVPESQATVGESTQCPRCGTENRPGLSFCRNCGQRLVAAGIASTVERPGTPEGTMACPRCGTHNRSGVAFCQNCGANLRGTAPGYVPPAAEAERPAAAPAARTGGAVLGPVVLLLGLAGIVTAYLLPFLYGAGSLYDRALGPNGYGVSFWAGYPEVGANLADQAYFGLAGPAPILGALLLVLAVAGFVRATPGLAQSIGLVVALLWSVGLIVLFLLIEVAGNWGGDIVGVLRVLTPAGIIFFLASLIILIGTLTRFARS